MADHKHGEMDTSVQEKTFDGFMAWTKWAVIVILGIIIWMAIFIT
ncbi:aa3-type cytochrome c oxidase subunit IV [uncultured Roseobacter sp.]|nr:aa3-type cytochrome c oxidase subunit IV [uncultured Roseobacter sp.]